MKKIPSKLVVLIIGLCMFSAVINAESLKKSIDVLYNNALKIVIDGSERTPEKNKPFIYEGTTYVPLRYISESLGKEVNWDGKTSTIYIGAMPGEIVYLTDIIPYNINDFDYDLMRKKYFKLDEKMVMGNKIYNKGLQLQTEGYTFKKVYYNLNGQYKNIDGLVGLDDSDNVFRFDEPVLVSFYLDNVKVKTIAFKDGDLPKDLDLDVEGGLQLVIEVGCSSNNQPTINLVNMKIK